MQRKIFVFTRINGVKTQKWIDNGELKTAITGKVKSREVSVENNEVNVKEIAEVDTTYLSYFNARSKVNNLKEQARIAKLYNNKNNNK